MKRSVIIYSLTVTLNIKSKPALVVTKVTSLNNIFGPVPIDKSDVEDRSHLSNDNQ